MKSVKNNIPVMSSGELYHDYKLVKKMKVPIAARVQILKQIFKQCPDRWRVVGITEKALLRFKEYDFKYAKGMQVQRSHLHNSHDVYVEMMQTKFESHEPWWKHYYKNDETILATSSENLNVAKLDYFPIKLSLNLFKYKGYIWTHGLKEIQYLKELYTKELASKYGKL